MLAASLTACSNDLSVSQGEREQKGGTDMDMSLTSSAFANGGTIPARYTADGPDLSPPLAWSGVPEAAERLVLICDDPDAPSGNWIHWVAYDIPADLDGLEEGVAPDETILGDAKQGVSDFGRIGYGGPAPPPGKPHRYIFTLYAVDKSTGLKSGASKVDVLSAIEGQIIAKTTLTGLYGR